MLVTMRPLHPRKVVQVTRNFSLRQSIDTSPHSTASAVNVYEIRQVRGWDAVLLVDEQKNPQWMGTGRRGCCT